MACILDLPDEILVYIFSFFSCDDIQKVLYVNSRFCRLAGTESIWENFCRKLCFLENKENITWKETFCNYYQRYGHYLLTETELFGTWKKLINIVELETTDMYDSLQDGLDEQDIALLENQWQVTLPTTLKFLYRLCGGQNKIRVPGLFGSICTMYSRHMNTYTFCRPADLGISEWLFGNDYKAFKLLPISEDHFGNQFCIALPKTAGLSADSDNLLPYTIIWKSEGHLFHAADSLLQWIKEYTERVRCRQYVFEDGHILRYFYHPDSVCHTGSISAKAGWVASNLERGQYMQFEYRITLEMKKDADLMESCQLRTRHWDITNSEDGSQESVDGPGVVGEYPIMKPGTSFSWMSRIYFKKPGGTMSGYFTMQNLSSMNDCQVACPLYNMTFPKEYQLTRSAESVFP